MADFEFDVKSGKSITLLTAGKYCEDNIVVNAVSNGGSADVETYEGVYEVTPKTEAQTLETANKFLENNISVFAIPYFDVSNTAGGRTIYIGREVEVNGN